MARAVTGTAAYARFALLEAQVRALLRETVGADDSALEMVSKGLSDPHYIEKIAVRGLLRNYTIGAELRLEIDWRLHAISIKAAGERVQVPSTWTGGVAPSLSEAVRTFNKAVDMASLATEWVVVYAPHFNGAELDRMLGFSPAPIRRWAREPDTAEFGFGPLGEASLVIGLAID